MENSVKQRSNKPIIILLVIIIVILLSLVGYLLYDKFTTPKQNLKEQVKEEVKKEEFVYPEKQKEYTFIKMNEQKVNFGSKDHKLITYYYSSKQNKQLDGPSMEFNILKKEVYLDTKRVVDIHDILNSTTELTSKDVEEDERTTKVEYVNDSKNNNKYVLLTDGLYPYSDEGANNKTILFDENGNVVSSFLLRFTYTDFTMESKSIDTNTEGYKEHNYDDTLHKTLYIGKNYLYYLDIENCHGKNNSDDYFIDEYLITIEDGQLNKKKVTTYDRTEVIGGGAMPNCTK